MFNKKMFITTPIDGRKNNWIGSILDDGRLVFRKLIANKKRVYADENIEFVHYWRKNNEKGMLFLTECCKEDCTYGKRNNGKCIV